jgi:hypothetical protein
MASIEMTGSLTPRINRCWPSSGMRWMSLVSSTTSATGMSLTRSISTIPTPRTSILPAIVGGAVASRRSPSRFRIVWSSLTSVNPRSSSRSARSDLPEPEGPVMSTARPSAATVLAWIVSAERRGPLAVCIWFIRGPPPEALS